ncbi:hypothetical protein AVEN_64912-1 [Araneus ventricosus]|uniref:Uncharacterized protein n=1 Tax=Araneus ventricosus TaxID=182803 RepID=A0A4Y2R9Q1_ARAVE|nr:hypothetical protein AVEN_64912-1 [Araneus ventricosus]
MRVRVLSGSFGLFVKRDRCCRFTDDDHRLMRFLPKHSLVASIARVLEDSPFSEKRRLSKARPPSPLCPAARLKIISAGIAKSSTNSAAPG